MLDNLSRMWLEITGHMMHNACDDESVKLRCANLVVVVCMPALLEIVVFGS